MTPSHIPSATPGSSGRGNPVSHFILFGSVLAPVPEGALHPWYHFYYNKIVKDYHTLINRYPLNFPYSFPDFSFPSLHFPDHGNSASENQERLDACITQCENEPDEHGKRTVFANTDFHARSPILILCLLKSRAYYKSSKKQQASHLSIQRKGHSL